MPEDRVPDDSSPMFGLTLWDIAQSTAGMAAVMIAIFGASYFFVN